MVESTCSTIDSGVQSCLPCRARTARRGNLRPALTRPRAAATCAQLLLLCTRHARGASHQIRRLALQDSNLSQAASSLGLFAHADRTSSSVLCCLSQRASEWRAIVRRLREVSTLRELIARRARDASHPVVSARAVRRRCPLTSPCVLRAVPSLPPRTPPSRQPSSPPSRQLSSPPRPPPSRPLSPQPSTPLQRPLPRGEGVS